MDAPPLPYDPFRGLRADPRRYLRSWRRGRRKRADFAAIRAYCLFLGTPRSGHSVIGAMLNAHPRAVIAHGYDATRDLADGYGRDQIFWQILRHDRRFSGRRRSLGDGFDYAIPGQSQGRYDVLEVIGNKRGGGASRSFGADPGLFPRLVRTVGVPVRVIHVVRHPLDNVATIARRHDLALPDAADWYFEMVASAHRVLAALGPEEFVTVRHEDFVAQPEPQLAHLCEFLGLAPAPDYLAACAKLAWSRPRPSRDSVSWPGALREEVAARAVGFPALAGYAFEG